MVYLGCDREYAEQVTAEHKVSVKSGELHIHAGGQEFRPLWDREFRQRRLALQYKVCIGWSMISVQ